MDRFNKLRAFSAEATARFERSGNDHVYGFDLHDHMTLYASDLALLIECHDSMFDALEALETALTRDMGAGYAGVALCQAAIAKAKGGA